MRQVPIYSYYAFGYNYRLLRSSPIVGSVHGKDGLKNSLNDFFEKLDELNLEVTKAVAADLYTLHQELDDIPKDVNVSSELSDKVITAMNNLDSTLDGELGLRIAYILTPKRFDLSNLLNKQKLLFGKNVPSHLSFQAKNDVVLGFRCIAFELPTAAAFHLLRATEEMIRQLYFKVIRYHRIKNPMWYGMVDALRKRKKNKPKAELLDHLDAIRKNYRNPTQHPDKFYDIDEVQDMASMCISALNMIVSEIKKLPE